MATSSDDAGANSRRSKDPRRSPARKKWTAKQRQQAIKRWFKISKGIRLSGREIRDLINEGRR
jgi:hypothetical protein